MTDEVLLPGPPAESGWDLQTVVDSALAVLRIGAGDPDYSRVTAAAEAATELIDSYLDAPEPLPVTDPMLAAAVQVTVELYRRKDAPFGVLDAWSQDAVAVRISSDPLMGVLRMLDPDKVRWGIG